jgi:NADPH-dependent 2,4-dienoyl-CoA reductase/sulfur reductase-like enzyme
MKAITVEPKKPGSARCEDAPEPDERKVDPSLGWEPQHVLVTGAGPIGLLAALLGRQRGL